MKEPRKRDGLRGKGHDRVETKRAPHTAATTTSQEPDLKFHPLADLFPLMEGEEFDALVADVKANGQREPIVLFEKMILDGRNRYRACLAAGVEPYLMEGDDWITDPAAYVISANIHRRHLTAEQKRELIAKLIAATPTRSDRQIAKTAKASPTFVGKVRSKIEEAGDVSTVDTRTDTKGRKQPAKRKRKGASGRGRNAGITVTEPDGRERAATQAEVEELAAAVKRYGRCALNTEVFVEQPDGTHRRATEAERTAWLEAGVAHGEWRGGLLFRAKTAAGDALFEDWSQFKVDPEVVSAAKVAADAWAKVAAYLQALHDKQQDDDPEASADAMKAKLAALDEAAS
jgi:hypothetical protein